MKRAELLAPCGSYDSFLAAVRAGADAVYLGGELFGARAYAENFTQESLIGVIGTAHLFGVRVYLTVNTLVKEQEFGELDTYLRPLAAAGIDGLIIQDLGVLRFCLEEYVKKDFPALELHASTQTTVTGSYGARLFQKLGCCRVVPARELSLQELKRIKADTGVELEVFVHGAMCYCYSGQCLMSSLIGGRSGNRGRCAQPCRLPYSDREEKEAYYLSLKDMNTIAVLPEILEAEMDSLKIEGRMKRPEYVAGVVSLYRKYIDLYCSLKTQGREKDYAISRKDQEMLSSLYIRSQVGEGYYHRRNGREMVTLESPAYSATSEQMLERLCARFVQPLDAVPLQMAVKCHVGEPLWLQGSFVKPVPYYAADAETQQETISVSVSGPVIESSLKRPAARADLEKQLSKLGGTPYVLEGLSIDMDENCFVPVKVLNDLRRDLVSALLTGNRA